MIIQVIYTLLNLVYFLRGKFKKTKRETCYYLILPREKTSNEQLEIAYNVYTSKSEQF